MENDCSRRCLDRFHTCIQGWNFKWRTPVQIAGNNGNNERKIQPNAPDRENPDLDELINYISHLLEQIEAHKTSSRAKAEWPTSSHFCNLKDFLSEGIGVVKYVRPGEASTVACGFLQGMGTPQLAIACVLVVANLAERFEAVSQNRAECLINLIEMKRLACHVKDIGESAELIAKLEKTVREATALILEGYMMCSTQTKSSKFVNFFKTNVNKNELRNFRDELDRMYRHINTQINILSAKMKNTVVSSPYRHINTQNSAKMKNTVLSSPYPDAVGIEYSVNKVLGLFRWEIANKAIAIILHGPEGIGKSVLADAVFSKINTTEFCSKIKTTELKRSKVELFDKLNSASRDTVELQKLILRDLNGVEETPEIRKREDGQAEIRRILEKVEAIIYIDHVLGPDALGFLLPTNLNKVKKLRLLLHVT